MEAVQQIQTLRGRIHNTLVYIGQRHQYQRAQVILAQKAGTGFQDYFFPTMLQIRRPSLLIFAQYSFFPEGSTSNYAQANSIPLYSARHKKIDHTK